MSDVTAVIESVVQLAVQDMDYRIEQFEFEIAFEKYKAVLQSPLELYRDHASTELPNSETLTSRFKYETALLHVVTQALAHDMFLKNGKKQLGWPALETNSYFSWYKLPASICVQVNEIATQFVCSEKFWDFISELSGQLRNRTSEYDLGEYYTPLPLVHHLISVSGFLAEDLFEGKRVIDPACGSGIVITTIAKSVVEYCQKGDKDPAVALDAICHNLYGFDVQPFAVAISKSLLIHVCSPLSAKLGRITLPSFDNVRLVDTLVTEEYFGDNGGFFDYVIGNPPFVSVKKEHIPHSSRYEEILYGHPNLYQLFLWWAVKATVSGGKIAFVLPQSILIGTYSKRLRESLARTTVPLAMTRMIDRAGVVAGADQQMMVACLQVKSNLDKVNHIDIRVSRNGTDIEKTPPKRILSQRVLQNVASSTIWVISDNTFDYTILERLHGKSVLLSEMPVMFLTGTGTFVWNQHKQLLSRDRQDNAIPLISSASIDAYIVQFPYLGKHQSSQRMFARLTDNVKHKQFSGRALLVQRTTPRKIGRRIVAGIIDDNFHLEFPTYFLENHVNYVQLVDGCNSNLLDGLNAWLNSDIVNFVFQLRNGTAHISLFELDMLPVVPNLLSEISLYGRGLMKREVENRQKLINDINKIIYDWLDLGPRHQNRIQHIMQLRERISHFQEPK